MVTRRPSLIGRTAKTMARTAVIAGTATAVSGRVAGRNAAPADQPPAGLAPDALDQLKKLAELHAAGVLTDEEFATQKARLLS